MHYLVQKLIGRLLRLPKAKTNKQCKHEKYVLELLVWRVTNRYWQVWDISSLGAQYTYTVYVLKNNTGWTLVHKDIIASGEQTYLKHKTFYSRLISIFLRVVLWKLAEIKAIIDQTLDGVGHGTVFLTKRRRSLRLNSCFSSIFYGPPVCATVHAGETSKWEQSWRAKMVRQANLC